MNNNTYNGWANYDTWLVALWINNDYKLYCSTILNKELYLKDRIALIDAIKRYAKDRIIFKNVNWTEITKMLEEF